MGPRRPTYAPRSNPSELGGRIVSCAEDDALRSGHAELGAECDRELALFVARARGRSETARTIRPVEVKRSARYECVPACSHNAITSAKWPIRVVGSVSARPPRARGPSAARVAHAHATPVDDWCSKGKKPFVDVANDRFRRSGGGRSGRPRPHIVTGLLDVVRDVGALVSRRATGDAPAASSRRSLFEQRARQGDAPHGESR